MNTTIAGIDVGGTFTDLVLHDTATGSLRLAKVLSTPEQQADGLLSGLHQFPVPISEIDAIVHGTTVATNAVLERKGDRCALVTTRGFRDVLELRRRDRPTTYGLTTGYTPILPRSRSFEIDERINAKGEVELALDASAVKELAQTLHDARIESVAICLLNSYANPAHECQLAEQLTDLLPGVTISTSHEICPEPGEFERANTTAVNAFVRATMSRYLETVQHRLDAEGFASEVQVMQSNGGLIPARRAGRFAVRTLLSGPAAGTVGAAAFGAAADLPNVISCDMGGTSFDVALIPDGSPAVTAETSIDYGVPIRLPMVDITTIAAGGGSIASLDRAGILQVGPESAGSNPGPASYGRGGTRPTVTDANVVLGRLAAKQKLGTQEGFTLDLTAAEDAIRREIAAPLGITILQAALAIVRIANEKMARAIRTVSVDKGFDPRKFALVGFGGAGPMHVAELARTIGASTVLIPPYPGALSAYGCLIADAKYDYVTPVNANVDADGLEKEVTHILAEQRQVGAQALQADGFDPGNIAAEHVAEMSFNKQRYSIRVPLKDQETGWSGEKLTEAFLTHYASTYGGRHPSRAIRLLSLRTVVIGQRSLNIQATDASNQPHETVRREVTFDEGTCTVDVLNRDALESEQTLKGPLVIEQADCTIVLPPRTSATLHASGSIIVEVAP